jgi:hypothetical protein
MSNVLALVGEPLEPLFRLSDQSCLTYTVFLNTFRFILQLMRLDQSSYGGHSFFVVALPHGVVKWDF